MDKFAQFGWTEEFQEKWDSSAYGNLRPARVIADFGTSLKIAMPEIHTAELSGKLAHYNREAAPKVGDWVAVRLSDDGHAVIESTLPRRSEIARKIAGDQTIKQVIAANVDIAFVLLALDGDFSIERLRRFLYQLSINSIEPVIVLNKADKTHDIQGYIDKLDEFNLPIIVTTATNGMGVDEILNHIKPGKTAILLGSSGVGKSTLTNALLGDMIQKTQTVRESDATGKHTTVHRELFMLPGGGMLIDTPGIRELQLWGTEENLDENFDNVAALVRQCKYTTCGHTIEPGCAIRAALEDGSLSKAHYARYVKMKAELATLKEKTFVRDKQKNLRSNRKLKRQAKDILQDSHDEMDM